MEEIAIQTEYIKLQQLLKLASLIGQGSDTKILLEEGAIFVNGEQASERGKKIRPGDIVEVTDIGMVKVVAG